MFDREHRTLAHVPRWSILRINRRQSVAEHSFYVALYSAEIAKFIGWTGPYDQLMLHALTHDLDEIVTGDINSPTKKAMSKEARLDFEYWVGKKMCERSDPSGAWALSDPGEQVRAIVKLADIVEGLLYLGDERSQGNTNVGNMETYMWRALDKFWNDEFVPLFKMEDRGNRLLHQIAEAVARAGKDMDRAVLE